VTAALVVGLEGGARVLESRAPQPPAVEDYIWDWQQKWDGEFYTMRSDGVGWPPWEKFNRDGVRDRTHALEKPQGVERVVFLGDSVTFGDGLQPAEAFPQLIQERLDGMGPGVEVFNLALWGWSTRQERIAYRRIARPYGPDHVVLGVCLNDIPELQNNLTRPPRLVSLLHRRSALVRRIVDAPGREIRSVEELFRAADSRKVRLGFERLFSEVRALRDEVRADGATLTVVIFPFRFQLLPDAPPPTAQERIVAFCVAADIPHVDLLPELRRQGPESFRDYDHLSASGARLVAEVSLASGVLPEPIRVGARLAEALELDADVVAAGLRGEVVEAPVVESLLAGLKHPEPDVRRACAWAVPRLGPGSARAAEALIEGLGDPEESVRAEAARALGKLGQRVAIPRLFETLGDARQRVRWEAARALHELRLTAPEAVEPLAAALGSEDAYVRGFAAHTLGSLGRAAAGAVPALIGALGRREAYGRAGAAEALSRMGPAAHDAIPAILRGLAAPDGNRRWRAARALGRIGLASGGALGGLVEALGDPEERVRTHAAKALGRIGPGAVEAAGALARATRDPEEAVREEAREALRRISG